MRHRITGYALLAMLAVSSAVPADDTTTTAPAESTGTTEVTTEADHGMAGNVQFLPGQTYLHDFWQPLDEPLAFGIEIDFAPKTSPVHVAFAWHASAETEHVSPYWPDGSVDGFAGPGRALAACAACRCPPYLGAGAAGMVAAVGGGPDCGTGQDESPAFRQDLQVATLQLDRRTRARHERHTRRARRYRYHGQVNLLMGFSWGH
jgi:hypothetical protein